MALYGRSSGAGPDPSTLSAWARELRYLDHAEDEIFVGPRRIFDIPEDPSTPDPRVSITQATRLEDIAVGAYDTPHLWWVIADASGVIDPFDLTPGDELRVPALSTVQAEVLSR